MHDANGNELKAGDKVIIPATITVLHGGEDYCNANVQTALGRRPDGIVENISSINTGVLVKVPDDVDFTSMDREDPGPSFGYSADYPSEAEAVEAVEA